ncbi:MAG: hypothetical protein R2911_43655 [Caldilineaceae bacterium]
MILLRRREKRTVPVIQDGATQTTNTRSRRPRCTLPPAHLTQLLDRLAHHASAAWELICAGSLPAGMPPDSYAHILRRARTLGLTTLLDVGEIRCALAWLVCPAISRSI